MEAVKFIKERNRMFKSDNEAYYEYDEAALMGDAGKMVDIVEKWSEKHPPETRQDELLKHYPKALLVDGHLDICPVSVCGDWGLCNKHTSCEKCKEAFWKSELKDI